MRRSTPMKVGWAALLLVACGGADEAAPSSPNETDSVDAGEPSAVPERATLDASLTPPDAAHAAHDAGVRAGCLDDLASRGVKYRLDEARGVVDAVRVDGPINGVLFASETSATPLADPVACEFVRTLWTFADLLKERGFVRVGTLGSYCYRCCCAWSETNTCRSLTDPEPTCANGYSNHSWGRAIDVRYLYKADGTRYDINANTDFAKWSSADTCGSGIAAQKAVSRELYSLACEAGARRIFETVLTPNYNGSHRNHFHMDIGQSGTPTQVTVKSHTTSTAAVPGVDDLVNGARCDE